MGTEAAKAKYGEARRAWESGQHDVARSLYLESIAADGTFPLPHYDLGSLLELSDAAAARQHYAAFIELGAGDEKLASLVGRAAQKLAALPDPASTPPPPSPPPPRPMEAQRTPATGMRRQSTRISDYPLIQIVWGLLVIFGGLVGLLNWIAANSNERNDVIPIIAVPALIIGALLVVNGSLRWAIKRRKKK